MEDYIIGVLCIAVIAGLAMFAWQRSRGKSGSTSGSTGGSLGGQTGYKPRTRDDEELR